MSEILAMRLAMELHVELESPIALGQGPYGVRCVFAARGGTFDFRAHPDPDLSRISGRLVPGPADYCLRDSTRDSHYLTADVRAVLQADQPHKFAIYMRYQKCIAFSNRDAGTLAEGKTIDFKASHFIVQPQFEVGDCDLDGKKLGGTFAERIRQLNTMVAIAHAELGPSTIDYKVYEIYNHDEPPPYDG